MPSARGMSSRSRKLIACSTVASVRAGSLYRSSSSSSSQVCASGGEASLDSSFASRRSSWRRTAGFGVLLVETSNSTCVDGLPNTSAKISPGSILASRQILSSFTSMMLRGPPRALRRYPGATPARVSASTKPFPARRITAVITRSIQSSTGSRCWLCLSFTATPRNRIVSLSDSRNTAEHATGTALQNCRRERQFYSTK